MTIRTLTSLGWFGALIAAPAIARGATVEVASISSPKSASASIVKGADAWVVYGTKAALKRDPLVVGNGSVDIAPLGVPADPWTSGAVLSIPQALSAGQSITVAFWVKASVNETVDFSLQASRSPYTAFYSDRISLTPQWQRIVRTGTASSALQADTQVVTVQLGKAIGKVTLGPLAIIDGSASAASVDHAFASFHPDRLAEAVRISSDPGVTLAGTLRTPAGHGVGPFPLAICVQGHGPNGRGGFDVLMNRLLSDGIATLEYDKRGIGASTGTYSEDMDALTRDAQAAVAAMRQRRDIDGSRIAIVGHSQGGAIAPAVAASDPRIAAIVTFAGPVGDGLDLFRRSMHDQLMGPGRTDATLLPLVQASADLIDARSRHASEAVIAPLQQAVINGFVSNGFTPEQARGALSSVDKDEVYQIIRTRTASDLRSLRIPVLELFGALDPVVLPRTHAVAAERALAANPAGKVVVFDGVSHWFKEGAKTGSEVENNSLGANIGSPRVVKVAGDWLRNVLATPAASVPASH